ncbi:MAG: hypothetical protein WCO42_02430 [bacterium]
MNRKTYIVGALVLTFGRFSVGADMCSATAGAVDDRSETTYTGMVLETTNVSRYTYVQIDTGREKIWAAGPACVVKAGDRVSFTGGVPNKNFSSPVLKRKFEELYFVGQIVPAGSASPAVGATKLPLGHPAITGKGEAVGTTLSAEVIQKPAGGNTVAEVWAGKAELSGKQVVIRAKVIKVSPKILGKNWLHLRDGTGAEGANDLVVTTKAEVSVGDVITVRGTLNTEKDFGSGYRYDVIMEDATVITK